jgi:hypothetical protein
MLGWALFVPLGFIDPVFAIGLQLLEAPSLRRLWTSMYNTPLVPTPTSTIRSSGQRGGLAGARRADLLRRALGDLRAIGPMASGCG